MNNLPANLRNLREIVAEYDAKVAAIPDTIREYDEAIARVKSQTSIGGAYSGNVFGHGGGMSIFPRAAEEQLLKSAWMHVYEGLNIKKLATVKERKQFEMSMEHPAPFTLDNIAATFGDYVKQPRFHILKGLAECFCDLDPAYKSHSKVKIGVEGLPKRIIVSGVTDYSHGSWGRGRIENTINALNTYRGKPLIEYGELSELLTEAKNDPATRDGVTIKRFKNGNAHLIFEPETLREINLALAEFYGDILPDTPDEAPKRRASTAVSKDLQFYRTPDAVVDEIIASVYLKDGAKVLEPSCGDGAILDGLKRSGAQVLALGIEVDKGRAEATRAKGYSVLCRNFLETAPKPDFDFVLMNPPFYGKHYAKHVAHGRKFLKPGGTLVAILPASAHYDHDLLPRGDWRDLPTASFRSSGTNIATGYFTCRSEAA